MTGFNKLAENAESESVRFGATTLDIGCGSSKSEGTWGIDLYPFPGVDQTLDLNVTPWDLPSDQFETIYANHIIEHVASVPAFMNEVHRISKDGATLKIVTPHFSSVDSYGDPTHVRHLASGWYKTFTEAYLHSQISKYAHLETKVVFGRSTFKLVTQLIIKLKGVDWWEKKLSFVLRARNFETTLKVIKN